jgi:hypothetical protein
MERYNWREWHRRQTMSIRVVIKRQPHMRPLTFYDTNNILSLAQLYLQPFTI